MEKNDGEARRSEKRSEDMKSVTNKISCEECREHLGDLLAADGAAASNGSASPELADVRAHLESCKNCRADLKLLSAARVEMRAMPTMEAPVDLRFKIRTMVEREPVVREFEERTNPGKRKQEATEMMTLATSPFKPISTYREKEPGKPPVIAATPHTPWRHDIRDVWDRVIKFLQVPTNAAWTSGFGLAVFCLILLARPDNRPEFELSKSPAVSTRDDQETPEAAEVQRVPGAPAGAKGKAAPPLAPLPIQKTVPVPLPGTMSPVLPPPVPGQTPMAREQVPAKPLPPAQVAPKLTSPRITIAPGMTPSTSVAQAPVQGGKGARFADSGGGAIATAPSAGERPMPEGDKPGGRNMAMAAAPPAEMRAMRVAPATSAGASAAYDDAASSRDVMAKTDKDGSSERNERKRRPMRASTMPDADERQPASPPVNRQVTARIKPPRDVGWGQVSVTLSGGASFDDGTKTRIIWRGNASNGEPIDVNFRVSAPRGSYSAHVVLQEVKKGDAQTVAADSVVIKMK